MRFFRALKAAGILFCVLACGAAAMMLWASPVFEMGESYELYAGASSSSPVRRTSTPALDKLLSRYAGESVRYDGDRYEELAETFQARLLFTEEVDGVRNYYMYSPFLRQGVQINGYTVNLHIAVREGKTAAGTPLIFGGY